MEVIAPNTSNATCNIMSVMPSSGISRSTFNLSPATTTPAPSKSGSQVTTPTPNVSGSKGTTYHTNFTKLGIDVDLLLAELLNVPY